MKDLKELVRLKIVEAVPEIKERSILAIGKDEEGNYDFYNDVYPITLADVLRATGETWFDTGNWLCGNGLLILKETNGESLEWKLAVPLEDQDESVITFLAGILGVGV